MYDHLLSEISIFKRSAVFSAAPDQIDPHRVNRVVEDWLRDQRRSIRIHSKWSLVPVMCVVAIVIAQLTLFPAAPGTMSAIAVLVLMAVMFGRSILAERRQNLQRDEILFALWRSMYGYSFDEDITDDRPQLRIFK